MDSLDLDHSSLVINYEMPRRASHYISSFGPFGRSGLRTLMINFCVKEDPSQLLSLESMEAMYDIKVREMQVPYVLFFLLLIDLAVHVDRKTKC